ncbi:hypothetical protein VIGAN_02254800 [Vigna angularis var. angularis]|uniref:J domain-containing protein n=1 Tax=Vigna angularis var. angularis TaxID=157739 RepID=A0A0S3RGL5_PHAAN|nr:uncharacterized protein LOC108332169 isoform X1 [Vigna angularis]BAT79633.1 hypothetical protein VIGAN_02254800 [Vigna angularis var. angularis]
MPRVSANPSSSRLFSMASTVRAYTLPIILFAGAMYYQLFVIPNAFPRSHYDVLQIESYSSVDKVKEAYENLESKMNSAEEAFDTHEFLKIRYAYELLTNPLWKRDYDIFGIDEQLHIVESASKHYAGKHISELDFPLLQAQSGSVDHSSKVITASDFQYIFPDVKPWLMQLYSSGSENCAQFSKSWNKIASLLDDVANIGVVELGEKELAIYLADRRSTGKPFFRNGVPSLVAIPAGCRSPKCIRRFNSELTVDKVTDWFATTILGLPQINYYSRETLVPNFLGKTSHHKVKVLFFSTFGERAAPFIRQAAKDYWAFSSFAFILWREEESSYWLGAFGVESAPAIVFLKDPGVKPVVHHGSVNNSIFLNLMENNKQQELRQLRSMTSMELGCDPHGYSRAGYDTMIWYCAIVVGRPSLELNRMRETMYRVQETFSKYSQVDASSENQSLASAVDAFKRRRLTFAWLDGEKQKDYCQFYLGQAGTDHTCGQRRSATDIPRLFVIRYLRNNSAVDLRTEQKSKWKSSLVQDLISDSDLAGQFVAGYKGEDDVSQITHWLANIISDGDSRDLPFFTLRTPELVPDDTEPIWSVAAQNIPLKNLKQSILGSLSGLSIYREDPRVGPFLLLGALISLGTIWLRRSQQVHPSVPNQSSSNQPSESNQPSQPSSKMSSQDEKEQIPRNRVRSRSNKKPPPSMTDFEPSNSYQVPLSDSDSE